MTYTKTVWTDRVVSTPNKYTKSSETSTSVTLVADSGTVTQAGTPINAANLNKIEQGIADALPKDGSQPMTGNLNANGANIGGSVTTGYYQDASNLALRLPNSSGGIYLQTPSGTGTFAKIGPNAYFELDGVVQPQFRKINGYVEWNNGGTWQGVGGVKSIQKGTATIPNSGSGGTVNVTISAVVTSKSIVHITSINYSYVDGGTTSHYINPSLTTSTNIAFSHTAISGGTLLSWEVVEYY